MSYELSKRVISNYLRSGCKRRLALDLLPEREDNRLLREQLQMPPKLVARPGLRIIQEQGDEWERLKIADVDNAFGRTALIANPVTRDGIVSYQPIDLASVLRANLQPSQHFIVQGQFPISLDGAFEVAMDLQAFRQRHGLTYSTLRPDLIQRMSPGSAAFEVLPDGSVRPVTAGEQRIPLRVIDVKLTAEPSNAYYAEVVYYSMCLSGSLRDGGFHTNYYVSAEPAVWPGSHDASELAREAEVQRQQGRSDQDGLLQAMQRDLEAAPFEVFAPRLRRFLREELREAIETPWQELPWHVGTRCSGCEYLGIQWRGGAQPDPNHCYPTAQTTDNLSRVPFVSRGARGVLENNQIGSVAELAAAGATHPSLRQHQTLRATRTVVAGRAQAISQNIVVQPPDVGTSAMMPRWADLRLYLTADFDIGSGITGAFGVSGFFYDRQTSTSRPIPTELFIVDTRNPVTERRELLRFLDEVALHIDLARQDVGDATLQVYIWDQATYEHLVRVIGRHLPYIVAQRRTQNLIWLFPPDEIIPNPSLSDRKSPICLVQQVVKAVVAAPVDHYYSLLRLARVYHRAELDPTVALFEVNDFFEDQLTDQIPSERIHEIWAKEPRWNWTQQNLERTVKVKHRALQEVIRRLEDDLRGSLTQSAPRITDLRPPANRQGLAEDSKLWLMFQEWSTALAKLKNQQLLCMPEHEREARFYSALLVRKLEDQERLEAIALLGLPAGSAARVFVLADDSSDFRGREGDFTYCLRSPQWSSLKVRDLADMVGLDAYALGLGDQQMFVPADTALQVTIARLDRDRRLIALEIDGWFAQAIDVLERSGALDLSGPVMLDPSHRDFLIKKLWDVLRAVGNPPEAQPAPEVLSALPSTRSAARRGTSTVQSQVLWNPGSLATEEVAFDVQRGRELLEARGMTLNESQWDALGASLTRRLNLVWGPPGTGKSRTLRAILAAIGISAGDRTIKVLVTGPTYEALANIIGDSSLLTMGFSLVGRITSAHHAIEPATGLTDFALTDRAARADALDTIRNHGGALVVSATAQQAFNLVKESGQTLSEVFDYIVIDEASQMDVGIALLAITGLKRDGCLIIAGDPKQLPPIHEAVPDESYSYLVSSIYEYLLDRFNLPQSLLRINYRSNQEIVSVGYAAGYSREFRANEPTKRLRRVSSAPDDSRAPDTWPPDVPWSPAYATLFDPNQPVACFVYREGRSCQSNEFEAALVARLVMLARLTVRSDQGDWLCEDEEFWTSKVGIVTPHRAQQSLVTRRLQQAFPDTSPTLIREAVDTVERFQGQEREIIIASYAIGDEDAISLEETFIMSLNRFNVTVSRARTKLITILTQELVDHLSNDPVALRESAMVKSFVENVCSRSAQLAVPGPDGDEVLGDHRWIDGPV